MAEEAERWNGLETARLFRTTEDNIFLQNTTLEKAALLLKNACQAVSHNMQFLYILRNDCITPKKIQLCGGSDRGETLVIPLATLPELLVASENIMPPPWDRL